MAKIFEGVPHNPLALEQVLRAILADLTALKTAVDAHKIAVDELIDDHATVKTVVDELTAWAETLATKLNADAGVTDTNYDAIVAADAPATLTASKPTAVGVLETE